MFVCFAAPPLSEREKKILTRERKTKQNKRRGGTSMLPHSGRSSISGDESGGSVGTNSDSLVKNKMHHLAVFSASRSQMVPAAIPACSLGFEHVAGQPAAPTTTHECSARLQPELLNLTSVDEPAQADHNIAQIGEPPPPALASLPLASSTFDVASMIVTTHFSVKLSFSFGVCAVLRDLPTDLSSAELEVYFGGHRTDIISVDTESGLLQCSIPPLIKVLAAQKGLEESTRQLLLEHSREEVWSDCTDWEAIVQISIVSSECSSRATARFIYHYDPISRKMDNLLATVLNLDPGSAFFKGTPSYSLFVLCLFILVTPYSQ